MADIENACLQSGSGGDGQTTVSSALLQQLAASLKARKVPSGSYIMLNLGCGEFVTGKTPAEARHRFELLHPGAEGWMQRVGELIGWPEPEDESEIDEMTGNDAAAEPPTRKPGSVTSMGQRPFSRRENCTSRWRERRPA